MRHPLQLQKNAAQYLGREPRPKVIATKVQSRDEPEAELWVFSWRSSLRLPRRHAERDRKATSAVNQDLGLEPNQQGACALASCASTSEETPMLLKQLAAFLAGLTLLVGSAWAQSRVSNPRNEPPGQMMQQKGSVKGSPGASGYAPGHEMQAHGSRKRKPGASGYAPGHEPTGSLPKRH